MLSNFDYVAFMIARTQRDLDNIQGFRIVKRMGFAARLFYEALQGELRWYLDASEGMKLVNPNHLASERDRFMLLQIIEPHLERCCSALAAHRRNLEQQNSSPAAFRELEEELWSIKNQHDGYVTKMETFREGKGRILGRVRW
jgi:hypothetical protein